MILFPLRFLLVCAALATSAGVRADIYGFVEGGRVSVMYSELQPNDPRYTLFKKEIKNETNDLAPIIEVPTEVSALRPTQYSSHIQTAAKETRVDPALIHAVISVESGYNASARSHAGAVGLMQLMPGTAKRYGVKDRLDPKQNIHGGARYLRDLQVLFDNNLQLVLAAYNAGEEAVMKYGRKIPPYRETTAYVPKVMKIYQKYRPSI